MVVAMATCADPVAPRTDVVRPEWLTDEAMKSVGPDSRFILDDQQELGTTPEISYETARAQGVAWLASFGPGWQKLWDEGRGAHVDITTLSMCERSYYSRRTYDEIDVSHVTPVRRPFGPEWLISFCDASGDALVSLALSAYNTDVGIVDGKIRLTSFHQGGSFFTVGVPKSMHELPISPERAACLAYVASGKRVASRPELHMPASGIYQYSSRWKVMLESPVDVQLADARFVTTDVLWIGSGGPDHGPDIAISDGALSSLPVEYSLIDSVTHQDAGTRSFVATPRAGRAAWTKVVNVAGGSGTIEDCTR
jgi:hypothetical protein